MQNPSQDSASPKHRLFPNDRLDGNTKVVPKGATLTGDMEADSDLNICIEGVYNGKIVMKSGGSVHISAQANVTSSSLVADFIYVEGKVTGDLHARKGIEISSTARINGSIRYEADLDFHPGARVSGQLIGPDHES